MLAKTRKQALALAKNTAVFMLVVMALGAFQTSRHLKDVAAPSFALTERQGARVDLSSLRGKPTLLLFFAPWCPVCGVESQNISWLKRIVGDSANVVSVVSDYESTNEVERFVAKHEVDYPVLLDNAGVTQQFSVRGYPTAYFVDRDGRIKRSAAGYTSTLGLLWRLLL